MPIRPKQGEALARFVMSLLFLVSGFSKLAGAPATQAYMEAYHVPGILLWPAAAWELTAGVLLVIGLWVRPLAVLLACWCVLTALIFHTDFADQFQLMNFLKNLTMAGRFRADRDDRRGGHRDRRPPCRPQNRPRSRRAGVELAHRHPVFSRRYSRR